MAPKSKESTHISIVAIGHADSGKSTTVGQLLLKHGCVGRNQFEKLEKEANEIGKGSFKYAWILDKLKAERERGITIDLSVSSFGVGDYIVTIMDAPGHRDFINNMVSGTSQADCALLVISAAAGEFEAGMAEDGQTKEHALLANALGVRQMIVAVNKMDQTEPPYSEARFNEIVKEVSGYIKNVGYNPNSVAFVPISGFTADNVIEQSQSLKWFRGWAADRNDGYVGSSRRVTLHSAINLIEKPERPTKKPLRVSIREVYEMKGIGTMLAGRVETGVFKSDTMVTFAPNSLTTGVEYIERNMLTTSSAEAGQHINFRVKDDSINDLFVGHIAGDSNNDPPKETKSFVAQVIILNHPGEILPGYTPVVHCHTAHVACKFAELTAKIDRRTGRSTEDNPKFLKSGDAAIVKLEPTKPMSVESFQDYPPLSRIVVRGMDQIVAVGMIKSTEKVTR